MKVRSIQPAKWLNALLFAAVVGMGVSISSLSHAAQGCGFGNHMNAAGRCVPNSPGPWATPTPGRPDCWRNDHGELRCY